MTGELHHPRVGFIGAGRMATALARGLLSSAFTTPGRLLACDVSPEACLRFAEVTGAGAAEAAGPVWNDSDVVVLAVKPQQMADALSEAKPLVRLAAGKTPTGPLVVSIAAGIRLATIAAELGTHTRLVRVMPNTPCLVGAGASAFALGGAAGDADARLVEQLLSTVGLAVRVPEASLDAVTGLSGSGPAFVYQIIEALSDGGVRAGLPRETALQLAAQTVYGAARMVLETGEHPAALKDAVASPGGTTIAGLHELERHGLRGALIDAVAAATKRSKELGGPPCSA